MRISLSLFYFNSSSALLLITVVNIILSLSKLLHLVVPVHHMKIISKRRCKAKSP